MIPATFTEIMPASTAVLPRHRPATSPTCLMLSSPPTTRRSLSTATTTGHREPTSSTTAVTSPGGTPMPRRSRRSSSTPPSPTPVRPRLTIGSLECKTSPPSKVRSTSTRRRPTTWAICSRPVRSSPRSTYRGSAPPRRPICCGCSAHARISPPYTSAMAGMSATSPATTPCSLAAPSSSVPKARPIRAALTPPTRPTRASMAAPRRPATCRQRPMPCSRPLARRSPSIVIRRDPRARVQLSISTTPQIRAGRPTPLTSPTSGSTPRLPRPVLPT